MQVLFSWAFYSPAERKLDLFSCGWCKPIKLESGSPHLHMENESDHAVRSRYQHDSGLDTNLGGISLGIFTKLIVISSKVYVDNFLPYNDNKLGRISVNKSKVMGNKDFKVDGRKSYHLFFNRK